MDYLFACTRQVLELAQQARHILLLSDYDGTLTPIVERPEMAILPASTRTLLQALARRPHFTVGVISGRALADLKEKVNIDGVFYAGNHGFEIEGPGLSFINPLADEIRPFLRMMRQLLVMAASTVKGVLVEDKGLTLSVHYRQVEDEHAHKVQDIVEKTTRAPAARGLVKVTQGKKVFEVRPAVEWNKGKAIRLLMKRLGKGGRRSGLLPIYLGDDLTDEDGFEIIEKYGYGLTVRVGPPKADQARSAARYFLNSVDDVYHFLDLLLEYSQKGLVCEQFSTS